MELSKNDKRIARQVIEKGLQKEYALALQTAGDIFQDWEREKLDNRGAYMKLYRHIVDCSWKYLDNQLQAHPI